MGLGHSVVGGGDAVEEAADEGFEAGPHGIRSPGIGELVSHRGALDGPRAFLVRCVVASKTFLLSVDTLGDAYLVGITRCTLRSLGGS